MASPDDLLLEEELSQTKLSRNTFFRLVDCLKPYRKTVFLNLILTVLAVGSQLAGPKLIQYGMDRCLLPGADLEKGYHGIGVVAGIFLINLVLGWGLTVAQVRSAIRAGQGAMNDLRLRVFEHIQHLSLNYFDQTHQGRILNRADGDIEALDRILTWGANQLLASALTLIGVVALMFQYDWRLCLAVSVVIPPLAVATWLFHRHGMEAYRGMRRVSSRITALLAECVTGVRVIQAYTREEVNLTRFRAVHDEYGQRVLVAARVFHTYMPFVGLLSGAGTAIILGYGGHLALRREITVGELAAFVFYLGMFFGPIQTMGDLYNAVLSTAASAERIFQLLDTQPQINDRPGAIELPPVRGEVEFDEVWLRYDTTPADQWILKHISFRVPAGKTIALVGSTGSGKTSIISLLMRFYEPQKGSIRVDGHDILQATADSLHRQFGIVTQDNFLFTGTVLENLRFGRPDASEEQIYSAARRLGTHEMIEKFKEGYQTKVTERGANFSAGERQLLCFTRAMVAEPRLLILDEATSSVDPRTEQTIQNALERLFEHRTSFVIAHRLSTIRHAYRILVLQNGEIAESGTHDELLAHGGIYAGLHDEFVRT
ncbi:MAG TPA: ABC transporter ATP-binding protein [Candidatus Limnocylindria bacterium]|jgi:ATP-binding cassette subfamily B protein|nr:ABC transporter ATP-binding protein [Candidatus Limnocylindria bacterium]